MLESTLQKQVIKYLSSNNIYYENNHGSSWGGKGRPDLTVCLEGKWISLELKVGNNQPSPAQIIHKNRIEKSGGKWYSPRSLEEVKRIVEENR